MLHGSTCAHARCLQLHSKRVYQPHPPNSCAACKTVNADLVVFECSPALLLKYIVIQYLFVFMLLSRKMMNYSDNRHSHTAVASGYLFKVSHNGTPFARWHRRYYVLYSDGLLYSFKNARSKAFDRVIAVGRMCLRMKFGAETSAADCASWPKSVSRKLCFSIINSDRAYHFFCESEREFDSWRQHFLGTLDKLASPSSHWAVDWGDMNASEKDAASNHSMELCATCPKEQAKSRKEKETVQIEVESEEDEQLTYDMVVHGYFERHDGVESEREKEEGRRGEHTEPTLGSVSEGNESTAVTASTSLEPSVEKTGKKETCQGNVEALQVGKITNPDVEGEENLNDKRTLEKKMVEKRTVENSKLDERTNVANHVSLEEQMFIGTVDPGVPKIVQLEREILSLYPEEDGSEHELEVKDMIESVFNEITSLPVEYSPRKRECEEQKLSSNTQVRRSGGETSLQHAFSSKRTVQVTVSVGCVRDSWSVHNATNKSKMVSNRHGYVELQKEVLTCLCGRRACVFVFQISVPPSPPPTHTHRVQVPLKNIHKQ